MWSIMDYSMSFMPGKIPYTEKAGEGLLLN